LRQHGARHGVETTGRLPGEALAILEFDEPGCTGDEFVNTVIASLGSMAEFAQVATDQRQREAIWDVRRQTSVVLKEQFPKKVSEDIAVPRHNIKAFIEGAKKMDLPVVCYGHLGDGNIHVNILSPECEVELEKNIRAIFVLALKLGGTITGEHGIGLAKRDAWQSMTDPWQVQAVRAIKNLLDPLGIFNAGKVI
jgi:FAD/FMN-containing dehydrogenase